MIQKNVTNAFSSAGTQISVLLEPNNLRLGNPQNHIHDGIYLEPGTTAFPGAQVHYTAVLMQWQYWWWFWFSGMLAFYYIFFSRSVTNRLPFLKPKATTSYRSHGRWGDLIICAIPIFWCLNILSSSHFLLRALEWQTETSPFLLRVRGKQWYWVYKLDLTNANSIEEMPVIIGRGKKVRFVKTTANESNINKRRSETSMWKRTRQDVALLKSNTLEYRFKYPNRNVRTHLTPIANYGYAMNNVTQRLRLDKPQMFMPNPTTKFNSIDPRNPEGKYTLFTRPAPWERHRVQKLEGSLPLRLWWALLENLALKTKELKVRYIGYDLLVSKVVLAGYLKWIDGARAKLFHTRMLMLPINRGKPLTSTSIVIKTCDLLPLRKICRYAQIGDRLERFVLGRIRILLRIKVRLFIKGHYQNFLWRYRQKSFIKINELLLPRLLKSAAKSRDSWRAGVRRLFLPIETIINDSNRLRGLKAVGYSRASGDLGVMLTYYLKRVPRWEYTWRTKLVLVRLKSIIPRPRVNPHKLLTSLTSFKSREDVFCAVWAMVRISTLTEIKQSTTVPQNLSTFRKSVFGQILKNAIRHSYYHIKRTAQTQNTLNTKSRTIYTQLLRSVRPTTFRGVLYRLDELICEYFTSRKPTGKDINLSFLKRYLQDPTLSITTTKQALNTITGPCNCHPYEGSIVKIGRTHSIFVRLLEKNMSGVKKRDRKLMVNVSGVESFYPLRVILTEQYKIMLDLQFRLIPGTLKWLPELEPKLATAHLKIHHRWLLDDYVYNLSLKKPYSKYTSVLYPNRLEPGFIEKFWVHYVEQKKLHQLTVQKRNNVWMYRRACRIKLPPRKTFSTVEADNLYTGAGKGRLVQNSYNSDLSRYTKGHSNHRWVKNNFFGKETIELYKGGNTRFDIISFEFPEPSQRAIRLTEPNVHVTIKQKKISKTTFGSKLDEYDIGSDNKLWVMEDGQIKQVHDYVSSYKQDFRSKHVVYGSKDNLDFFDRSYPYQKRLLWVNKQLVLPTRVAITIITNSYDVIHSWFIPGLGLKLDCVPGRSTHHTIYIEKRGYYYGQCAEVCGRRHHHMPIKILAVPYRYFVYWWKDNIQLT